MSDPLLITPLTDRALVSVRGEGWRAFLQNLLTNDVEPLADGQARFTALLTPQGRLLYDLFVIADGDGALLDVAAEWREALIERLMIYRLRARVAIAADARAVGVCFSAQPGEGGDASDLSPSTAGPPPARGRTGLWVADPRLPALGWRVYGAEGEGDPAAYEAHRLALGVPGAADWGTDRTYPIEADFDLLNGIDFSKGCFVGQETTSRMKRRGTIKTRMLPIVFEGTAPAFGTEVLAGSLRAGEVLSGADGRAMALLRLDRIEGAGLTADGRPVQVRRQGWMTG